MAQYTILVPNEKIPAVKDEKSLMKLTEFPAKVSSLDGYIAKVSALTNVPVNLIKLFAFLTSKGDKNYIGAMNPISAQRVPKGFMGISENTAQNTIYKEFVLGRISQPEYTLLLESGMTPELYDKAIQYAGTDVNADAKVIANKEVNDYAFFNKTNPLKAMPVDNAQFNILVGAMLIGQLLDKYKSKLEQIIPIYMNLDNPKNLDFNWATKFQGTNMIDLYNKLSTAGKNAVSLAISKGGFLNTFA